MTREKWLEKAIQKLRPIFKKKCKQSIPRNVKVTVSFPLRSSPTKTMGQCIHRDLSEGKLWEILISPIESEGHEVIATLAHELIHVCLKNEGGHGSAFQAIGRQLGFGAPWKNTPSNVKLMEAFKRMAKSIGRYPHKKISPTGGVRKQGTRMIKMECSDCGFICRAAYSSIIASGVPTCGCGMRLTLKPPKGEE